MTRATATSRETLQALLANLPGILAGSGAGFGASGRIREAALRAGAVELLSLVQRAFVEKARGGTDEAGIRWAPLKPATVAYGRRHPGLAGKRKKAKAAGRPGRPLLTDAQDRLWRAVFASALARASRGGGDGSGARAQAAAAAWAVVKAAGGKTVLGEYGGRPVEVGRDTGRLLASLSPGARDNLLELAGATVTVGTDVPYAKYFHARRPLWPDRLPEVWQDRVAQAMADAAAAALAREVG